MECIFVGDLSPAITGQRLATYFSPYGQVTHSVVIGSRGYGFVTFESAEVVKSVLDIQSPLVLDGRQLTLKQARRRRPEQEQQQQQQQQQLQQCRTKNQQDLKEELASMKVEIEDLKEVAETAMIVAREVIEMKKELKDVKKKLQKFEKALLDQNKKRCY